MTCSLIAPEKFRHRMFCMLSSPLGKWHTSRFFVGTFRHTSGQDLKIDVAPVCMTFEDFFAAFSKDSHPSFSVSPQTGRMDRRGGEKTRLTVRCDPKGQAGTHVGNLVINLPEDNSKICYKITATCF